MNMINDIKSRIPEDLWEKTGEENMEGSDLEICLRAIEEMADDYNRRKFDRIASKLPNNFYLTFCDKLKEVFNGILPSSPINFSDMESTNRWYNALMDTCNSLGMNDFAEWYNSLSWRKSDVFDGYLERHLYYTVVSAEGRKIYGEI